MQQLKNIASHRSDSICYKLVNSVLPIPGVVVKKTKFIEFRNSKCSVVTFFFFFLAEDLRSGKKIVGRVQKTF